MQLLEVLSGTVLIDSWTEAFMHGAHKHTLASTVGTLPDAKLLSNFEWFGSEKSATIDTSHISKVITEADFDPSIELITFCNTVIGRLQIGLSLVSSRILKQLSFTRAPWLSGAITDVRWRILPACLQTLGLGL